MQMASVESGQLVWGPYRQCVRQWGRRREKKTLLSCQRMIFPWGLEQRRPTEIWRRCSNLIPSGEKKKKTKKRAPRSNGIRPGAPTSAPSSLLFGPLAFSISFDTAVSFSDSSLRSPVCCGQPLPKSTPLLCPLCSLPLALLPVSAGPRHAKG